ncbi:MAG: hypothetical protein E6J78_08850 [Deltaproteobacteria bacterium]|nr:MAG: hypothetical protein E6J78_08850 [Deltaproteobacteria bacterium]
MRRTLAALLLSFPAFAAHVTDVADAADERHPLEVDLDATYFHLQQNTRITREQASASGTVLQDELQHSRAVDGVMVRVNIGLWHDLELHAFAPYYFRDVQDWNYAGSTTATTSSLTNNTINAAGCGGSLCGPTQPIAAVPGGSRRRGLGDTTIGIAWGPINEQRETKLRPKLFPEGKAVATWVMGVDYTLPFGQVDDPSRWGPNAGSPQPFGMEAKRAHVLTLWTAFSKRYQVVEPYVKISASAPFATTRSYDNCSNQQFLAQDVAPANCAGLWKGQTGYQPPYEAGLLLGAELVTAEDLESDQRFSFDVRGDLRYHGPGREYTQVTDALGKLTYADEYLTTLGSIGLYGRLARWFHLRVYGTAGFETAHFLTHEEIGENKDGKGIVISAGRGVAAPDQNPNYDFRVDQVGRRLRAEPAFIWGVAGSLSLNF